MRQQVDTRFAQLDTNKDGQLSKAEFMAVAPTRTAAVGNGQNLLTPLDKNKDAKVSLDASATFRHPEWAEYAKTEELDDRDLHGLAEAAVAGDEAAEREPEVRVRRLLASLTSFDRRVLELRLGFGGRSPASLASVARELRVPVGRVRRAEARALEQLRARCPRELAAEAAS